MIAKHNDDALVTTLVDETGLFSMQHVDMLHFVISCLKVK